MSGIYGARGGDPQAKWLKHLQIFDFWRESTQRRPSRRRAVSPRQARLRLRVAAAIALLDRGWGKPPQSHTGQDSEGPIIVEIVHRPRCSDRDEPKLVEHVDVCSPGGGALRRFIVTPRRRGSAAADSAPDRQRSICPTMGRRPSRRAR